MANYDPVINGYSRSVIVRLIQALRNSAEEEHKDTKKTVVDSFGRLAAMKFSRKEAQSLKILAQWLGFDYSGVFENRSQIENFFSTAEKMLDILAPENEIRKGRPDIVEL